VLFNIFLAVLRILLVRRNKQKAALEEQVAATQVDSAHEGGQHDEGKIPPRVSHANAFADMTDKVNPAFRYEI
jgi:hypothetical protein